MARKFTDKEEVMLSDINHRQGIYITARFQDKNRHFLIVHTTRELNVKEAKKYLRDLQRAIKIQEQASK